MGARLALALLAAVQRGQVVEQRQQARRLHARRLLGQRQRARKARFRRRQTALAVVLAGQEIQCLGLTQQRLAGVAMSFVDGQRAGIQRPGRHAISLGFMQLGQIGGNARGFQAVRSALRNDGQSPLQRLARRRVFAALQVPQAQFVEMAGQGCGLRRDSLQQVGGAPMQTRGGVVIALPGQHGGQRRQRAQPGRAIAGHFLLTQCQRLFERGPRSRPAIELRLALQRLGFERRAERHAVFEQALVVARRGRRFAALRMRTRQCRPHLGAHRRLCGQAFGDCSAALPGGQRGFAVTHGLKGIAKIERQSGRGGGVSRRFAQRQRLLEQSHGLDGLALALAHQRQQIEAAGDKRLVAALPGPRLAQGRARGRLGRCQIAGGIGLLRLVVRPLPGLHGAALRMHRGGGQQQRQREGGE